MNRAAKMYLLLAIALCVGALVEDGAGGALYLLPLIASIVRMLTLGGDDPRFVPRWKLVSEGLMLSGFVITAWCLGIGEPVQPDGQSGLLRGLAMFGMNLVLVCYALIVLPLAWLRDRVNSRS